MPPLPAIETASVISSPQPMKASFFEDFFSKNAHPTITVATYSTDNYRKKCHFTFTGKERDSETGYSYFGARYYDSGLPNIFLSVDPMSDKYPSISPYAYCAWNPVKLVDPDGREIWIVGDDGNSYKYYKGRLYTKEGKEYKGNDGFANKVRTELSYMKRMGIRKEIKKMEKSDLKITISKGEDNSHCSMDEIGERDSKIGSSSSIVYNPSKSESRDGKRLPVYGLAHELGHAYDAMTGMIDDKKVPIYKKGSHVSSMEIPISEIRAVRFENRVRPGNKQRTTYDGYDLTPHNVVMKKKDGTPK